MLAIWSPLITSAAPMSSSASTLIASSTLCSGRMQMRSRVLAFSRSYTVFIAALFWIRVFILHPRASHVRVIGPAAALGNDPADVLHRVLDVARLAVHAVGGVDLQPRASALGHDFVNTRRAVARLRSVVEREVHRDRDLRILEGEVHRLGFLVIRVLDED